VSGEYANEITVKRLLRGDGESNFQRKKRTPFSREDVVDRCTPDEFVRAVEVFDEVGGAEPGDGCGLKMRALSGSLYVRVIFTRPA